PSQGQRVHQGRCRDLDHLQARARAGTGEPAPRALRILPLLRPVTPLISPRPAEPGSTLPPGSDRRLLACMGTVSSRPRSPSRAPWKVWPLPVPDFRRWCRLLVIFINRSRIEVRVSRRYQGWRLLPMTTTLMAMTVLRGSLRGVRPIESQVELQDVDARRRADDRARVIDRPGQQLADSSFGNPTSGGNTTNLVLRGFRADVGVETR